MNLYLSVISDIRYDQIIRPLQEMELNGEKIYSIYVTPVIEDTGLRIIGTPVNPDAVMMEEFWHSENRGLEKVQYKHRLYRKFTITITEQKIDFSYSEDEFSWDEMVEYYKKVDQS